MKKLILFYASIIFSCSLAAAEASVQKNELNLGWGYGKLMEQNFVFTPVLHQDRSPLCIAINYQHTGKKVHKATIRFSSYETSTLGPYLFYWDTPEELSPSGVISFTRLDVHYSLGKTVLENGRARLLLGARSSNKLYPSYYYFGPDWLGSFGYYFAFGIDTWTRLDLQLKDKQQVSLNLSLPLFAFIARSPYMSQNDEYYENNIAHSDFMSVLEFIKDGNLQSWGRSQGFDLELSYRYSLTSYLDIGATFRSVAHFNQEHRKMTSLENALLIQTIIKF